MTLNEITDAFLDKVKEIFANPDLGAVNPGLQVDHYPDDPASYQFAHPKGAVLLILQDRRFEHGQATDGTGQPNRPVLLLTYFSRNLRGKTKDPGAYELLDLARRGHEPGMGLSGFCIGGGYTWCRREYYIGSRPGGVWIYGQEWILENYFDPDHE